MNIKWIAFYFLGLFFFVFIFLCVGASQKGWMCVSARAGAGGCRFLLKRTDTHTQLCFCCCCFFVVVVLVRRSKISTAKSISRRAMAPEPSFVYCLRHKAVELLSHCTKSYLASLTFWRSHITTVITRSRSFTSSFYILRYFHSAQFGVERCAG